MTDDLRCCGSGVCIIDSEGRCWCGQQWKSCGTDKRLVEEVDPDEAEHAESKSAK